jgi:hypothetical protein
MVETATVRRVSDASSSRVTSVVKLLIANVLGNMAVIGTVKIATLNSLSHASGVTL